MIIRRELSFPSFPKIDGPFLKGKSDWPSPFVSEEARETYDREEAILFSLFRGDLLLSGVSLALYRGNHDSDEWEAQDLCLYSWKGQIVRGCDPNYLWMFDTLCFHGYHAYLPVENMVIGEGRVIVFSPKGYQYPQEVIDECACYEYLKWKVEGSPFPSVYDLRIHAIIRSTSCQEGLFIGTKPDKTKIIDWDLLETYLPQETETEEKETHLGKPTSSRS